MQHMHCSKQHNLTQQREHNMKYVTGAFVKFDATFDDTASFAEVEVESTLLSQVTELQEMIVKHNFDQIDLQASNSVKWVSVGNDYDFWKPTLHVVKDFFWFSSEIIGTDYAIETHIMRVKELKEIMAKKTAISFSQPSLLQKYNEIA